jgi:hypothetical protein
MPMLAASLFATLLLGAQPLAAEEQSRLAQCLDTFVAAQQRERLPVLAWAQSGAPYLQADGEAFEAVLQLRNSYRTAYLTARQACAQKSRAGAKPPCAGK